VNDAGKLTKCEHIKSVSWFNDDSLSGRGRIWNNSFPLILKHFLIGSGANTFLFEYPQKDYIYLKHGSGSNVYNVKAHSIYVQQCVETGVIGLLVLLMFFGWYIVRSAKIYRRAVFSDQITWVGIGIFAAVVVYLIAALANDSNVCTAPVFWVILGLGFAVNRIIAEKEGVVLQPVAEAEVAEPIIEEKTADKPKQTKKQSRKKRKGKK
jgi:hypothetical protein